MRIKEARRQKAKTGWVGGLFNDFDTKTFKLRFFRSAHGRGFGPRSPHNLISITLVHMLPKLTVELIKTNHGF